MVDCIVEFDYVAEQPDELTIKVGQIIKNVVTEDGGWWEGELDGKKGMFPDNFVKIIDKKDKSLPTPEKKEEIKKDLKTQQRTSVRDLASKIKDGIPVGGSQKKRDSQQPVIKRAKVLFSYEPDNEDELKLEVDDIVDVFKQEEEGWWEGSLNGKSGVFPSNFVEVIEELEPTENIPEEKQKEQPQAEPKTKKIVGGVGLGNIFDGGPIKLRSATGAKKQPEPETKVEEPPTQQPPNLPKKEKQDLTQKLSPKELATLQYADQGSSGPSSDLTGNFFQSVFEGDNFVSESENDYKLLPEAMSELKMLQNYASVHTHSLLDVDKKVCFVDIHNAYGGEITTQVHPDLDPVLKASRVFKNVEKNLNEDSLIEYADVELDDGHTKNDPDYTKYFKLSDFSSKMHINNANNNNSNGVHITEKDEESTLVDSSHETNELPIQSVVSKKKKKTLMDKLNQHLFGRKTKLVKDVGMAFSNRVSPVANSKEVAEIEEKIQEEIRENLNEMQDAPGNTLQKFKSAADFLYSNTRELSSKYSVEDFTTKDYLPDGQKTASTPRQIKAYQSVPNIKLQKPSKTITVSPNPVRKKNYLAALNETGTMSPFMKAIANKYSLFQKQAPDIEYPESLIQEEYTESSESTTVPHNIKLYTNRIDSPSTFIQEDNPYVLALFSEMSPEKDDAVAFNRKRKSPLPRVVPLAKKRQTSYEKSMTERDFINSYVDNVLDDAMKDLYVARSQLHTDSTDHCDNSIFSHHKEEFELIRAKFESGTVRNVTEGTAQKVLVIPTLSSLCTDVLDDWERRFILDWKKKYDISSYSPQTDRMEASSYLDHDKHSNFSCPSTNVAKSEISGSHNSDPYWDCKLSLTGDSVSETSFNKGIDSYSLDQPSIEGCKKTGPWISPAPVRRDYLGYATQVVSKGVSETSAVSYLSDQSTQTTDLDASYYEMINISGNLRPVKTRCVSTSPIQEFVVDDISIDDNRSQNSSSIPENSPCVSSKPRYSSSPIANIPNLDQSPQRPAKVVDCNIVHQKDCKIKQLENSSRNYVKNESYASAQKNTAIHDACKVQRSRTLNYLSEFAQSLAERRQKRFAFRHLFVKKEKAPVKLLSFRKLSDSTELKTDETGENQSVNVKTTSVLETNVKTTSALETREKTISLEMFYPNEDFSTNDTFFNRSFEENNEIDPVSNHSQKYDQFGKWKVSYENKQPYFAFHKLENTERKYEFCRMYDNLISCGGDKHCSVKPNECDRKTDSDYEQNAEDDSFGSRKYTRKDVKDVTESPEGGQSASDRILNSFVKSDDPYIHVDNNSQYTVDDYPEDPFPQNLKMQDDFLKDDNEDIGEDELSADSLSFMASLCKSFKGHDFSETPKADVDDNGSNLNAFLQEALKPLDDLLSDDSGDEEHSITNLSPLRWRCTASDYPSFVSLQGDDISNLSDSFDAYPEPDVISENDPCKLEKITSDDDDDEAPNAINLEAEGCRTPDNSAEVNSDNRLNPASVETLDDWLKVNQEIFEYSQRKERYPTFTFVTPHKIDNDHGGCQIKKSNVMSSAEKNAYTGHIVERSAKVKEIFSTPGPNIYQSPEPNTCDNTFVSVSEMSFNESRGCTPYFTDVELEMDTTIEDPVLANTNNNEPLTSDCLNNNIDLFNDINSRSIEDSFNDVDLDKMLVPGIEDEEQDIVDV